MTLLKSATVKSYDAAAHKADVQIAGSLGVWLDGVRVATDIPAADVVPGRQCTVLFLDPSNQDDAVVITVQGALPSGGTPTGAPADIHENGALVKATANPLDFLGGFDVAVAGGGVSISHDVDEAPLSGLAKLAGRAGGQTAHGGTVAADTLALLGSTASVDGRIVLADTNVRIGSGVLVMPGGGILIVGTDQQIAAGDRAFIQVGPMAAFKPTGPGVTIRYVDARLATLDLNNQNASVHGLDFRPQIQSGSGAYVATIRSQPTILGGSYTGILGADIQPTLTGAGDVTDYIGARVAPTITSSPGSLITRFHGLKVEPSVTSIKAGSGPAYGVEVLPFGNANFSAVTALRVNSPTAGGTLRALEVLGTAPSVFEGLLRPDGHIQMPASGEIRDSGGTARLTIHTTAPEVRVPHTLGITGGVISMDGATNRIEYGIVGVAKPAAGSAGLKIKLYGADGPMGVSDYALGIEPFTMWFNTDRDYAWYQDSGATPVLSYGGDSRLLNFHTTGLGDRIRLYNGGATQKWGFGIKDWRFVMYMDGQYTGAAPNPGRFSWRQAVDAADASGGTPVFEIDTQGSLYSFLQRDQIGAQYKAFAGQTADLAQWLSSAGTVLLAIKSDGKPNFAGPTQTTAAAGAQTLPSNPDGFLRVQIAGIAKVIPYYNQA